MDPFGRQVQFNEEDNLSQLRRTRLSLGGMVSVPGVPVRRRHLRRPCVYASGRAVNERDLDRLRRSTVFLGDIGWTLTAFLVIGAILVAMALE